MKVCLIGASDVCRRSPCYTPAVPPWPPISEAWLYHWSKCLSGLWSCPAGTASPTAAYYWKAIECVSLAKTITFNHHFTSPVLNFKKMDLGNRCVNYLATRCHCEPTYFLKPQKNPRRFGSKMLLKQPAFLAQSAKKRLASRQISLWHLLCKWRYVVSIYMQGESADLGWSSIDL